MSFRLQRIRVGVLRGGVGYEYDVSLRTGASILKILREDKDEKYDPIDILIDKSGVWHMNGLPRRPEEIITNVDLVINALHGPFGEGGYVSKILDSFKIPHTGPSAFAGGLSQNKHLTKDFLKNLVRTPEEIHLGGEGIKMPYHELIRKDKFCVETISEIFRSVPMPAVVKPVDSSLSLGISIAQTPLDLERSIHRAFNFSPNVMVEEHIPGVEITCGVIRDFRGDKLYALMPTEVMRGDMMQFRTPARIGQKIKETIVGVAKKVHDKLNLGPYSRSDFIIHPKRGVMFLEVNSLPPIHEKSLFNEGLHSAGITPEQFLEHIILISLK